MAVVSVAKSDIKNSGRLSSIATLYALEYETLTFTGIGGNLVVTGNGTDTVSIFKTSGSSAWDNQAYVATPFTAPVTMEFNKQAAATDNSSSYAMISWNADPTTDASYTSLDWASYPYQTNQYIVYHNGSSITPPVAAWSTSEKWRLVYATDGYIYHYNGSTLMYSVNKGTGGVVYLDSSFYSQSATFAGFSNIRVIKKAWNGTAYV
jgi:hypothetical protein